MPDKFELSRDEENRELLKQYMKDTFTSIEEIVDWVVDVAIDEEYVESLLSQFLDVEEEMVPGSW